MLNMKPWSSGVQKKKKKVQVMIKKKKKKKTNSPYPIPLGSQICTFSSGLLIGVGSDLE